MFAIEKNIGTKKQLPEVFCKKGVLKNFAIFTGKQENCIGVSV